VNLDNQPYEAVDRILDLRQGLPFEEVSFIFAEHFLEHFDLQDALNLLAECRRVLADDGVLRLTTPNLDWVWATSYSTRWTATSASTATMDVRAWPHDPAAAQECVTLNRAFRAWGHKFLYNQAMLEEALRRAGFADIQWFRYGQSTHPELRGLDRHEQSPDTPDLPHVLVVEASGRAEPAARVDVTEYLRDVTLF
jgi:predicted SAM-dependent methyltransferase